ncbi:MAG: TRAP transporter large permease [Lachnospiraceae bacterium]|nr:TRAP transporter large permease [Lachnospiraceae bacterium]
MTIVFVVFMLLLLLNVPLAFAVGIGSLLFFYQPGLTDMVAVNKLVSMSQSFSLLAMPFFILAGNMMNETGITRRLIKFALVLTGHMRGGLAHVSCVLSCLMGGISGSNNADAAMESRMLGPSMIKHGYSRSYTAAVIGMTSLITPTIPPSLGMIQYGTVGEVSIGRLFAGGIVPGLLLTASMMIVSSLMAKKYGYKPYYEKRQPAEAIGKSFRESIWALLFPLILIVGIRFGLFTPTEAGAFAVVYALVIGKFVYKELTWEGLRRVLRNTAIDNGVIMLIVMLSGPFGYAMVYDGLPKKAATFITGVSSVPLVSILIIFGFLIIAGMFMEATVNNLLLTPIFLPIVKAMGFDPVWFGVIMASLVCMGGMTPPVGVTMYTVCSILDCPVDEYVKSSLPYLLAVFIVIALLVAFPQLILFIPNLIFGVR